MTDKQQIQKIVAAVDVLTNLAIPDHTDALSTLTIVMIKVLADSENLRESQAWDRMARDFAAAAAAFKAARAERRRQFKIRQRCVATRMK